MSKIENIENLENLLRKLGLKVQFTPRTYYVVPASGAYSVMFQHYLKVNGMLFAKLYSSNTMSIAYGQQILQLKIGDVVETRNLLLMYLL